MKRVFLALCVVCLGITGAMAAGKKKVFYINAYHEGYAWSDAEAKGIKAALASLGDKVELQTFLMNGKLKPDPADLEAKALQAKAAIEAFKPDVIITSDDIPVKYVIVPFYKEGKIPCVFCGVNWDASVYGLPNKNVTGVLEVSPYAGLFKIMRKYARSDKYRLGFLAPDSETSRKELENARKIGLVLKEYMAKDFDDYLAKFKQAQKEVDMLIFLSDGGLYAANEAKMRQFFEQNTEIITGSPYDFMAKYAVVSFAKFAEEQGELAARMAIEILGGKRPADIPVGKNVRGTVIINKKVAKAAKIELKEADIQMAKQIIE